MRILLRGCRLKGAHTRPKTPFCIQKTSCCVQHGRVQALVGAAPFFIKRMYLKYFGEALMKPILFSNLLRYFRMLRVLRRVGAPNHCRWTRKVVIAAIAPRTLLFNAHVPKINLHQVTWLHLLSRVNSQEKTIAQLESPCTFFKCLRLFFITKRQTYEGQKEKANKKRCRETPGVLYI